MFWTHRIGERPAEQTSNPQRFGLWALFHWASSCGLARFCYHVIISFSLTDSAAGHAVKQHIHPNKQSSRRAHI